MNCWNLLHWLNRNNFKISFSKKVRGNINPFLSLKECISTFLFMTTTDFSLSRTDCIGQLVYLFELKLTNFELDSRHQQFTNWNYPYQTLDTCMVQKSLNFIFSKPGTYLCVAQKGGKLSAPNWHFFSFALFSNLFNKL